MSLKNYIEFKSWQPENSRNVAVACGHAVKSYDLREKSETWSIVEHGNVKSIDFNPNKQNQLTVGGEDGEVRFYDVRFSKSLLKDL